MPIGQINHPSTLFLSCENPYHFCFSRPRFGRAELRALQPPAGCLKGRDRRAKAWKLWRGTDWSW